MILESKNIAYEVVDIAASSEDKEKMREIAGNDTALPPQIANNGQYCGVSPQSFAEVFLAFFAFEMTLYIW